MLKLISIIAAAALATGCASNPHARTGHSGFELLVDRPGDNYKLDNEQCNAYARQVAGAAEQAASGAVAGAIVGALFAAAVGANGYRNESAMAYGLAGGLGGAVSGDRDQRSVVRKCLQGRGYTVLN